MKTFLCRVLRARLSPLLTAALTLALTVVGLLVGMSSEWFLLALAPVLFLTDQSSSRCRLRRR